MGFLNKLKDTVRDKTRGNFCALLQGIGLDTQIVEREQPEVHIGELWKGKSQGLIEIRDSPIHLVNVLKEESTSTGPQGGGKSAIYTNIYLAPDPNIIQEYYEIKSIRKKVCHYLDES